MNLLYLACQNCSPGCVPVGLVDLRMDTKHCRASADHQRFEMAMVVVVEAVDTRFALAQEPAVKLQKNGMQFDELTPLIIPPTLLSTKKLINSN